ncbi:ABC transporter permease [Actinopolymorpha alba]|uniref:ABC transporter permease n=1 Tax=Actinopolymorpha alba TaxID=533267 RepID=UPI000382CBD7|nr:ABC transporter permease [Actinopolymorpha alba]
MAAISPRQVALPVQPWIAGRFLAFARYVRRNPLLGVGLAIFIGLVLFSTVGGWFVDTTKAPYPLAAPVSKPPSLDYLFGTDAQGRDMLAVMIVGTRLSLKIGLLAGAIGLAIGIVLGLVSAFYGGWIDNLIRWVVDVMFTIPSFLVMVVIASLLQAYISIESMAFILAAFAWPGPTRGIRAQVLSLRERQFIQMARLSGMRGPEIIIRELLPNISPFLLAGFVGALIAAVYGALGLELLGLGSQREPTLGMTFFWMQKYSALLRNMWWWWGIPIAIIILLILSLYFISFALDEWANPRSRRSE